MAPPIEISIPTTSAVAASGGEKAYTLYNITLRLPLRSYVFQKRYSEFAALDASLTSLVGEAPPSRLPGKSWFRSTIASQELTEDRRVGLEAYLRAIAESPDRRWRDTSVWRAFLNLPSANGAGSSSASGRSNQGIVPARRDNGTPAASAESRLPAIGLAAANAAAASDPGTWIDLHKEMKSALKEARAQLARRDAALTAGSGSGGSGSGVSSGAAEAGAAAKRELVKTGSLLTALTTGLKTLQETKRLGEGELRRRRDLLAAARVERDGLETLSASLASARSNYGEGGSGGNGGSIAGSGAAPVTGDRAILFGSAAVGHGNNGNGRSFGGGRVLGAPLPETDQTRELNNDAVLQLQKQKVADQDEEVNVLAKIVQRQRELGLAIKEEVDLQAPMLQQLSDDTDRVQGKMKVAKDRIKRLN
ncbi:regulator of vacuolar morphogenesis [Sporothrix brasiliensis 5110]|uniref:Regulator of vacuolar morphogenesis n=1 Tax=Sporothrix brasiliensis 5110 TaxID=1398154 RepID=A0A0C2IUR0_9PEZI|nr:regulator of vacuolar morphogenesis [Sporothrix brasiliensis 5110]KIH90515.1 regulator of vacuolar morphogenesis [Sporothrix brasiliensis 5110]